MAQNRHPYQLHSSHYQQFQPQYGVTAQGGTSGAGYAQQLWQQQGYHSIGVVTGQSGVSEGGQSDEMNNYHRSEFAASTSQRSSTVPLTSRRTLAPVPPATATPTTNSTTTDALHSLLTSRPSLLPLPKLAAFAGSKTSAISSATSRIAVLANVREQAVGQFIAMELKREKERKRKAEYRARKRAEEVGGDGDEEGGMGADEEDMEDDIGLEGTEDQQSNGGQKTSAEDSMSERGNQTRHAHESTPPITMQPQQYHHQQQNVIDPVLIGQGDSTYGSRLGMGGGEKVQVRVGDRIVAIELAQLERMIREQQAQQQSSEYDPVGSNQNILASSSQRSQSLDPQIHSQSQRYASGSGVGSTGTDEDGLTMEALMASASRNVPLPNTLQQDTEHILNVADDSRSQTDGEHDMNLNAANVLGALPASYASLTSLSSLINTHPSNALSNQGMSPTERRNVSPPASITNPSVPKQAPRQLTNWFQPILWTLIDETAEKLGFSKPAGIARHLKTTVSPRLFSRLGERQIRKWINDEKTGWKQTVLEKVTRQEVLAHVQAGLITVSSVNGAPNVSGSSVDAFDARARGSTSGPSARGTTRKTRSTSLDDSHFGHHGHTVHNTVGSNAHETLVDIHEEEARRK